MVKARSLIVSTCLYKGISKRRISTSNDITMYYGHRDKQSARLSTWSRTGSQTWLSGNHWKVVQKLPIYSLEERHLYFSPSDSFRNLGITGPEERIGTQRPNFKKIQLH